MTRHPDASRMREDLAALQGAALSAADPAGAVEKALRLVGDRLHAADAVVALEPSARTWLVAIGKASLGMASAAAAVLGPRLSAGVIAHPHGIAPANPPPAGCRLFAAGHPLPDEGSLRAGDAALEMLRGATDRDVVLVLVSGGGSALFESLRAGVTLADVRGVTEALQHAGADIVELNVVRRALSRTKGGGLARAAGPARVIALILSDVVGDPLASIASGPTIDSPTGPRQAIDVLERRGLGDRFHALVAVLRESERESGPPGAPGLRIARVVGSNRIAAEALCAEARARGFDTLFLTDRMQGEAREIGRLAGGIARGMEEHGRPLKAPACVVLGGETTVTVRGQGRGGRNLELALGAAVALEGCRHAAVFSFATDGLDGSSRAAGAIATGDTLARAQALGRSAHRALADNDSEPFFDALGDLWVTGPSGTNVNDLAVLLAYPPPAATTGARETRGSPR
jgi:glycerate 2-kinase